MNTCRLRLARLLASLSDGSAWVSGESGAARGPQNGKSGSIRIRRGLDVSRAEGVNDERCDSAYCSLDHNWCVRLESAQKATGRELKRQMHRLETLEKWNGQGWGGGFQEQWPHISCGVELTVKGDQIVKSERF